MRENPLGSFLAAVDGEGDALMQKRSVGGLLSAANFLDRQTEEHLVERPVVRTREPLCLEHLVIRAAEPVVLKPGFQEWRCFESGRPHGPPNFDGEDSQILACCLARDAGASCLMLISSEANLAISQLCE